MSILTIYLSPLKSLPVKSQPWCMQAQSPAALQQWLPTGAGRWMGGPSAEPAARLQISVSGKGLAACTSARLQTQDGALHDARIVSVPAVSLPPAQAQHVEVPVQSALHRPALSSMKAVGQRVMAMGRSGWQSLLSRGAPASLAEEDAAEGCLRLEVQLRQADAQAITSRFRQERGLQSTGSSGLRVHLRSDFEVVRAGLQLSRWQAWFLLEDLHMLEKVLPLMGASDSKHAYLPGVRTAIGGSVSYTCLTPSAPGLPAVAQLAAQQLRSTSQSGRSQTSQAQGAELNAASSIRPAHSMYAASAMSAAISRGLDFLLPSYKDPTMRAAQRISSAIASSAQHTKAAVDRTAGAVRAQMQRHRHRHIAIALQQHSNPGLLVLGLSGHSSAITETEQPRLATAYSSMLNKQTGTEQCPRDVRAAVVSLVEEAHLAKIPVLVVLSTEDPDVERCKSEYAAALHLLDRDRLAVIRGDGSTDQAFELKRAVHQCLEQSKQSPAIQSRL